VGRAGQYRTVLGILMSSTWVLRQFGWERQVGGGVCPSTQEATQETTLMDWTSLVGAMFFFTLLLVATFAFVSKQKTEKRMKDPTAEKSTLAKDKSSHGKPADV
jgi:cytochrome bd-type quinol oxidase subunit 1